MKEKRTVMVIDSSRRLKQVKGKVRYVCYCGNTLKGKENFCDSCGGSIEWKVKIM